MKIYQKENTEKMRLTMTPSLAGKNENIRRKTQEKCDLTIVPSLAGKNENISEGKHRKNVPNNGALSCWEKQKYQKLRMLLVALHSHHGFKYATSIRKIN
jgi:hypothetical protein